MKILIIRSDHIGDLFFSTCVFREIKKVYPDSEITLIVSKGTKELIKYDKNINNIIELEMPYYNFGCVKRYFNMGMKLRKMNFDIGIDLRGSLMNSALLLWLAGIPRRIGKSDAYESKIKQELIKMFLNVPVFTNHHKSKVHLKDENLAIMNIGMNMNAKDSTPQIITNKEDEFIVNKFMYDNKLRNKFICVLPLISEYKQWPVIKWKCIIKHLDTFGYPVLVMGSKDEKNILEAFIYDTKNCIVVPDFNVRQLSLLFSRSSLAIGHDGGPLHIAGYSGCKIIFLSLSYPQILANGKFLPLGNAKVTWCKKDNMDSITIAEVEKAIRERLK